MFLIMKHAGKDSDINVCVCVYIFFCAPFVSKKRQIELASMLPELENREIE